MLNTSICLNHHFLTKKSKHQGMVNIYILSNLTYACAIPLSHHKIMWHYDIAHHKTLWYSESNFDLYMKKILLAHTRLVSTGHSDLLAWNWGKFHRIKSHFLSHSNLILLIETLPVSFSVIFLLLIKSVTWSQEDPSLLIFRKWEGLYWRRNNQINS